MMSVKIFPEKISTCVNRLSEEDTLSLARMASSSTHGIGQPISDQNRGGQPSSWLRSLWVWPHYNTVFPEPLAQMQWTMGHFSLHNYVSQLCIINYLLSVCVSIICCLCIYLPGSMYRSPTCHLSIICPLYIYIPIYLHLSLI